MKKLTVCAIAALFVSLTFISCGSHKTTQAPYPAYTTGENIGSRPVTKVKEELDECETESLNEPANEFRSYGSAIDEDRDFARHQATLFAKAALADRIEALVLNVIKGYRDKVKVHGKSETASDIKQDIGSMAERVIENCRIICSNRYRLSNGTYECSVCISIPAIDAEKVAGAVTINDDERLGVEFREQQFRDSYREELERFRKQQKEKR